MSEQSPQLPLAPQFSRITSQKTRERPRTKRAERGTELVEFAMVLVPMISLLFLSVDAAWAIYARASLQEAVREGVRYGVITQSSTVNGVTTCTGLTAENSAITQIVVAYSGGVLNSSNQSDISIGYYSPSSPGTPLTTGQLTPGNIIQVSVTGVSVNLIAPFFVTKLPMSLSASAADVLEGSPCG